MPRILVLSGSNRETQAYAKHLGVRPTAVQHAFGANNVRGVTLSEVHELPSFSSRRDKHSILAALRYLRQYGRSNRQIEHKTVDWEYVRPAPQIEGELPGQTTIDDFIEPVEMPSPPEPETKPVEMPSPPEPKTKPVKMPEVPRPKRTTRKAVAKAAEPKPKTDSNALEPSSVDAFFQGS